MTSATKVVLRARDQISALAAATHIRCGTNSPARAMSGNVMWYLWETCTADTTWVGVFCDNAAFISFRACTMIGGILGGSGSDCVSVLAMNEKPWVSGDWIDPSRVVAWWERGDRIAIFDGVSGRVSCLLPGPSTALWYRVNSKWSVSSDTTGILTVGKITMHEELQQREPAGGFQTIPSVTLPVTPIFNGLRETCKSNPDKLLLSVDSGRTSRCFYVVDLAESYKRRVLRILSVTHFPVVSTAKILFMEKNNGQDVFIIAYELMEDKLQYRVVIVAAESGNTHLVAWRIDSESLYQMSNSLFAVVHLTPSYCWCPEYELWDCNCTDHPQSIVSLSPSVVGGFSLSAAGGFILSVSHTSELDVIDPTSGDVVLHIKLPPGNPLPLPLTYFYYSS